MGRKFVLVHGSGHGAWCWYKLIDRLQRQGHTAIAVDLYGSGVHQGHPGLVNTLAQYAAPLVDLLHSLPDNKEVILISHSMGGLAATKVMELFPHKIAASVFICSTMLRSGTRALEIVKEIFSDTHMKDIAEFNYSNGPENPPTSVSFQMDKVGEYLYHLSPSQDIVLAKSLLKPNVCLLPSEHVSNTTEDRYGIIPRFYIKTMEDRFVLPKHQDLYLANNPPKEVIELSCDHSPFFSAVDALLSIVLKVAEDVS